MLLLYNLESSPVPKTKCSMKKASSSSSIRNSIDINNVVDTTASCPRCLGAAAENRGEGEFFFLYFFLFLLARESL